MLPLHLGYITLISATLHFSLPLITFTSLVRYIPVSDTSLLYYIQIFTQLHLRFCYVTFTSQYIAVSTILH
jgi:hypothetical protein